MHIEQATVEKYVGLRYVPGEFDCGDLARLVILEVFGKHIALPTDGRRPTELRQMARSVWAWTPLVARERKLDLSSHGFVRDGDGVLLAIGEIPLHVGIAFWLGPDAARELYVLHNDSEVGSSVLTRWRDLTAVGFHVVGVYEWI